MALVFNGLNFRENSTKKMLDIIAQEHQVQQQLQRGQLVSAQEYSRKKAKVLGVLVCIIITIQTIVSRKYLITINKK